jgi:putative nucleotidyltransferase with HDIG domain
VPGGDLADPKRVFIIHENRNKAAALAEALKADSYRPQPVSSLSDLPRQENGSGPSLLVISAGKTTPEDLKDIKIRRPSMGIILLVESALRGCGASFAAEGVVDHIHDARFLTGILVSVRSEFRRLEMRQKNEGYRKTIKNLRIYKKESRRKALDMEEIYSATLENLMTALDIRDVETFGHSRTVAKYTQVLARILGISDEIRQENLRRGALLHDIGKIAIPDSILKKPSPLTPGEWNKIRMHPVLGYGLVKEIQMVEEVGHIILRHHERYDGQGYPEGLSGEHIPLEARIFSLADALDAITSHRPYRKRRSFAEAREEIRANSGSQFDPTIVEAFCSVSLNKWEKIRYETTKLLPSFEEFMEAGK